MPRRLPESSTAPKPEILRVLDLTANPEKDLRTEVEVRNVQQDIRAATHRDLIEMAYRPAGTPPVPPERGITAGRVPEGAAARRAAIHTPSVMTIRW